MNEVLPRCGDSVFNLKFTSTLGLLLSLGLLTTLPACLTWERSIEGHHWLAQSHDNVVYSFENHNKPRSSMML